MSNPPEYAAAWSNLLCFHPDFGHPTGAYNGILASALPLGSVIGLPLIPLINDTFGRRWCIMFGSCIMIIGTIIQGFSFNGKWACPCVQIQRR